MLNKLQMFALVIVIVFSGCINLDKKNEEYISKIRSTPAKQFDRYLFDRNSDLISRVQETPEFVLDYLREMDNMESYTSYELSEFEINMFNEYLSLLPENNRIIMEEKLIGIYFVKNLYGSALADYVIAEDNEIYNILVINPAVMNFTLSEWISMRENSCFINNDNRIQIDCGDKYTGLLYALLHESAHIVDYNKRITPFAEYGSFLVSNDKFDEENQFYKIIWKSYREVKKKYDKPFMSNISFYGLYGGPYIDCTEAENIYNQLIKSPFCSLYSCMSWAEDYAELVTWFYLTEVLGQPYTIKINSSDGLKSFSPLKNEQVIERFEIAKSTIEGAI
jgi:hypothetical protein